MTGYKKEPRFVIRCDSCGSTSVVDKDHKCYCPICGPGAITPLQITDVTAVINSMTEVGMDGQDIKNYLASKNIPAEVMDLFV